MQVEGDRSRSYSIVVENCQDNTGDKSEIVEKESLFDSNPNFLKQSTFPIQMTND